MSSSTSMVKTNRYRFRCPTTGREELFLRCHLRRYRHWRGEAIEGDCATCMRASKCAAVRMIQHEMREGRAIYLDEAGTTLHRVPKDIMADLERTVIRPMHGQGTSVTPSQLAALVRGDFDGVTGKHDVPASVGAPVEEAPARPKGRPPQKDHAKADMSGVAAKAKTDLAGAISAGMRPG